MKAALLMELRENLKILNLPAIAGNLEPMVRQAMGSRFPRNC